MRDGVNVAGRGWASHGACVVQYGCACACACACECACVDGMGWDGMRCGAVGWGVAGVQGRWPVVPLGNVTRDEESLDDTQRLDGTDALLLDTRTSTHECVCVSL